MSPFDSEIFVCKLWGEWNRSSRRCCVQGCFLQGCDSIAQVRLLRTQVHDEPSVWAAPSIRAAPPTAAARCALRSPLPLFHVSSGHSCPWLCSAPGLWGVPLLAVPQGKACPPPRAAPRLSERELRPRSRWGEPCWALGPARDRDALLKSPFSAGGPGGSCSWSCRLSSQESSGKKPWTADPLPNKGLGDQWPGQVRDTHRRGRSQRPQSFIPLDCEGIKARDPSWEVPGSSCYFMI